MHHRDQITAREAAALLGCSVATVNRMATDGRLPPVAKLPGLRGNNLFDRRDVEMVKLRREKAEAAA